MEKTNPPTAIRPSIGSGFIGKKGAFCQLQLQHVPGQVILVHKADKFVGQVVIVKMQPRHVHRNGHGIVPAVQPRAQGLAGLFPYV